MWDAAWTLDTFGKWEEVLEVMNTLQSLHFSPLQLWKTTTRWGNGELWDEVW